MRLFAISDLHLGFGVDKPMDLFGPQWVGHADKMRVAWDAMVGPDDWVLGGGDTSWGLSLAEARPDLDWLGERHADAEAIAVAQKIETAVQAVLTAGNLRTADIGGSATTTAITDAVIQNL